MPQPGWTEQTHADFSGLNARVTGLEVGFDKLQTSTNLGFDNLGKKIDAIASSRSTPITTFLATSASVAGVLILMIGSFFWAVILPISTTQHETVADLKAVTLQSVSVSVYNKDQAELNQWYSNLRTDLHNDEASAVNQHQISELKDRLDERYNITEKFNEKELERISKRIEDIDASLIKRPEIASATTALNDRIKELEIELNELRTRPPTK